MKNNLITKFLGIVVLGLLWCNNVFAECIKGDCTNGQGTYTWANGDKYVGLWKDDQMHGQGTFTWANGVKYVGEFKDDKMHGQGILTFADVGKYVGEFKDSKQNGQGTLTWPNGDNYVGEFKDHDLHGQGTLRLADGKIISGIWKNNDLERSLELFTFIDNWNSSLPYCDPPEIYDFEHIDKYIAGKWIDKWKNCYGTNIFYSYDDSNNLFNSIGETVKYVGEHNHQGSWHGKGTLCYENGDRWEGEFVNGTKSRGTIIWNDRSYWKGIWKGSRRGIEKAVNAKYYSDGTIVGKKKLPVNYVYNGVCKIPWKSLKPKKIKKTKEKLNEPKYCNINRHLFCSAQKLIDSCRRIKNSAGFNQCMKGVYNIGRTLEQSYGLSKTKVTLGMATCDCN